jgi:toxin ParE1/3/4
MARLLISRPARADLASILKASLSRWGERGRARYAALLAAAMQKVAADPDGPVTQARPELAPDLRSFHICHARRDHGVKAPVHVLYYRATGDAIQIVRVLHEHMDPQRHVARPTSAAPGRRTRHG